MTTESSCLTDNTLARPDSLDSYRMLKTIPISELRVDMFIAELIDEPGVIMPKKKRGMIRDERIIDKFVELGFKQVIIDIERGRDVGQEDQIHNLVQTMTNEQIEESLNNLRKNTGTGYHDLRLEWGTAKEVFQTSVSIVNHSLEAIKNGEAINGEYFVEAAQAISRSIMRNKDALTWLGKIRNLYHYLFEHSVNTSVLMGVFANACGLSLSQTEQCITAGLVHDLGQAAIREDLFNRAGPLSPEEHDIIKRHVEHGLAAAETYAETTDIVRSIIREHHERMDGSGYPAGLSGNNISIYGRMFAIVDTFDAVTNNRIYKEAVPSSAGMRTLLELAGTKLDQSLVHMFIKCMGVYPTGSLVKLSNGMLAIVISQTPGQPLKPMVQVIYNSKNFCYVQPKMLDLMKPMHDEKILSYEDPGKYSIDINAFLPEEFSL